MEVADAEDALVDEVDIAGDAASEQDSVAPDDEDGGTSFVLVLAGYQRGEDVIAHGGATGS